MTTNAEINNGSSLQDESDATASLEEYLSALILGKTVGSHMLTIYPSYCTRNIAVWRIIQIILGFHKHLLQYGTMFLDHEKCNTFFKLFENFDSTAVSELDFGFLYSFYHVVVGKYGHLPYEKSFAEEIGSILGQIKVGQNVPFSICPDLARNTISYPFEISIEKSSENYDSN